uniref:PDZ domain-containing protein n=1 Tax=Ascaris lumbricoides TaxID=6252 RepID=A0A0M3IBM1_ASCLU
LRVFFSFDSCNLFSTAFLLYYKPILFIFQDPLHPGESVIVVRSLVPGGVAQADGRIVPGDRLMFVNDEDLSNSTLDRAVAVLKAAPQGIVRLGIAKPVPIDQTLPILNLARLMTRGGESFNLHVRS